MAGQRPGVGPDGAGVTGVVVDETGDLGGYAMRDVSPDQWRQLGLPARLFYAKVLSVLADGAGQASASWSFGAGTTSLLPVLGKAMLVVRTD